VTIGNRLKEERERLGHTQTTLATLAATTKKTQIDYETGRTSPNAEYLKTLSSVGFDVTYIVTGQRLDNVARTTREMSLLHHYRLLDDRQRNALNELAYTLSGAGAENAK
jgi:transcriptional regulator with XRE-family HTH domain